MPVGSPYPASEKVRLPRQGLYANRVALEKVIALSLRLDMNAKFRVDDVADRKRTLPRSMLKRAGGGLIERFVGTRMSSRMFVSMAVIIDLECPR